MGLSEWGIEVNSKKDIKKIIRCMKDHNLGNKYGEELDFFGIIKYEERFFACLGNGGGREKTSDFLRQWWFVHTKKIDDFPIIYHPFQKPDGWNECKLLWEYNDDNVINFTFEP